ncbi:glycosyltransferase [Humitalea sp. 24SJ18S-53]|uniref:glycosyltransferase n=1 Tax=Humitalea sp. 24SJ18S-53 TaxID=3422307 RepID=UPI003D66BE93
MLAQSYPRYEILVVNDGSTDDTADMLSAVYGANSAVKVIHQPNGGVCVARNRGLDAAQGDFVAFLDSDDVWLPWKLEVQVACLTQRPEAGMIWTDMEAIGPDGGKQRNRFLREMYSNYRNFADDTLFEGRESFRDIAPLAPPALADVPVWWGRIHQAMILGNLVHTSTVMLTRRRLEQVGRFDESLAPAGEDHDFHLRTCEAGPVGLFDAPTIQYQVGGQDRLSRLRTIMAQNYLRTMDRAIERAPLGGAPDGAMLRRARAGGHAWLASALMEEDDRPGARRNMLASLSYRPFQPRLAVDAILTFLPQSLDNAARGAYRHLSGRAVPAAMPAVKP